MIRLSEKAARQFLRSKKPNAIKTAAKKATINGQSDEQYYGTDKNIPDKQAPANTNLRKAITEVIQKENGVVIVKCR